MQLTQHPRLTSEGLAVVQRDQKQQVALQLGSARSNVTGLCHASAAASYSASPASSLAVDREKVLIIAE